MNKIYFQEVGSIIGKRGDNIKAIREEVNSFFLPLEIPEIQLFNYKYLEWCSY
jgi:transcription antitermination factor NusA-like protein